MLDRGAGRRGLRGGRWIGRGGLRRASVLGVLVGVVFLSGASAALAAPAFTPVGTATSTGNNSGPFSVAFSPDGGLLATANTYDNTVSVFAVSAGGQLTPVGSPTATGSRPGLVGVQSGWRAARDRQRVRQHGVGVRGRRPSRADHLAR